MSGLLSVLNIREVHVLQPVGGTFFDPVYAQAIRKQFAEAVKDVEPQLRPVLVVFEDPNGQQVPEECGEKQPAAAAATE